MSLWFPIMVNSKQIGDITIVRRDDPITTAGYYTYDWTASMFRGTGLTKSEPKMFSGELRHRYKDGALVLIAKAMAAVVKTDAAIKPLDNVNE